MSPGGGVGVGGTLRSSFDRCYTLTCGLCPSSTPESPSKYSNGVSCGFHGAYSIVFVSWGQKKKLEKAMSTSLKPIHVQERNNLHNITTPHSQ